MTDPDTTKQPRDPKAAGPTPAKLREMFTVHRLTRLSTGQPVLLASGGNRLAARVIDVMFMFIIHLLLVNVIWALTGGAPPGGSTLLAQHKIGLAVSFALVGVLYEVLMTATTGQTPGKMVAKTRVVGTDSGDTLTMWESMRRWLAPAILAVGYFMLITGDRTATSYIGQISGLLALLVYASVAMDGNRRGWHDKLAGSVVVKAMPLPRPSERSRRRG